MSLRIPIPAEAKLAPTRRFSPVSCGLRYGKVDGMPIASPSIDKNIKPSLKIVKEQLSYTINCYRFLELTYIFTDNVRDVKAVRETSGGSTGRVIDTIRVIVGAGSSDKVIIVSIVDERVTKDVESPRFDLWCKKGNNEEE